MWASVCEIISDYKRLAEPELTKDIVRNAMSFKSSNWISYQTVDYILGEHLCVFTRQELSLISRRNNKLIALSHIRMWTSHEIYYNINSISISTAHTLSRRTLSRPITRSFYPSCPFAASNNNIKCKQFREWVSLNTPNVDRPCVNLCRSCLRIYRWQRLSHTNGRMCLCECRFIGAAMYVCVRAANSKQYLITCAITGYCVYEREREEWEKRGRQIVARAKHH